MSNPDLWVVNLAGHRGSGKTTAARYLSEHYDFGRIQPEMLCMPDTSSAGLPNLPHSLGQRLQQHLPGLSQYFEQANGRICIDSLLFPAAAQKLQDSLLDRYVTLALDCHVELRAQRLGLSANTLRCEEEPYDHPFYPDAASVMKMAESNGATIDANRPRQSVYQQLDIALGRLGIQ